MASLPITEEELAVDAEQAKELSSSMEEMVSNVEQSKDNSQQTEKIAQLSAEILLVQKLHQQYHLQVMATTMKQRLIILAHVADNITLIRKETKFIKKNNHGASP